MSSECLVETEEYVEALDPRRVPHFLTRTDAAAVEIIFLENALDDTNVGTIGDRLEEVIAKAGGAMVRLDFARVGFMDSAALSRLVLLHKRAAQTGARLQLVNLSPKLRGMFRQTKLDSLMEIQTRDEEVVA